MIRLTEAQIAHLKSLETERGELTPRSVVDDARQKASPLHELFVWDKNRAALRHWLQRARHIIGSVRIVVQNQEVTIKAPMYVRDMNTSGGAQGYRSVTALKTDPVQARESLIYTLETASGHIRRAYHLAGPLGLQHEIDALLDQVVGVQRRISSAA